MPLIQWIKKNKPIWSIQAWLRLLAFCSVLPFTLIGLWQLNENQIKIRETEYDNLRFIANGINNNINTEIEAFHLVTKITGIELNDQFKGKFSNFNADQYMRLHPQINNLELRDKQNQIRFIYHNYLTPFAEKEAWLKTIQNNNDLAMSDVLRNPNTNELEIIVTHPILEDGKKNGHVAVTVDLLKLNAKLLKNIPDSMVVFGIDKNQNFSLHTNRPQTWIGKPSKTFGTSFPNLNPTNSPQDIVHGKGWIYTFQQTHNLGWTLFIGTPEEKITRFIRQKFLIGLASFIATLSLALILAWKLSETIARPIRRLADTAKLIAQGASNKMENKGPKEIRELALQFNEMLYQLAEKRQEHNALTEHYSTLLHNARDILLLIDQAGRIIETNQAAVESYGYSETEMQSLNIRNLFVENGDKDSIETWLKAHDQLNFLFEARHQHRDGSIFNVEISANFIHIEGKIYRQCFIRDISVRKNLELIVANRTRALEALNASNRVIASSQNIDTLTNGVCEILVYKTGYKMAWFGIAQYDSEKTVRPTAKAGAEDEFIDNLKISWNDDEFGQGPTGTAIRTKKSVVARDLQNNPNFTHWREAAEKNHFKSSVALPIQIDGEIFGVLNIYSIKTNSFDDSEVELLEELARNLENGINLLQSQQLRNQLIEELTLSERRFRSLIELSPIGIYTTVRGKIVYANPRLEEILGYHFQELHGKEFSEFILPEDLPIAAMAKEHLEKNNYTGNYTLKCRHKDGFIVELGIQQVMAEFEGAESVLSMAQDIGERVRANAEIERYVKLMEHATEATLEAVSIIVEQRDPYTAGHEKRVGILAADIGKAMQLSEHTVEGLRLTGIVHDVGKIGIPAEILAKPSRLTSIEMALIREHAQAGYNILKNINFPWPIAEVVYQHHERIDGSGYPRGLKGEEILLEARIMAVADVVESMTSHRPYRPGLGMAAALFEIQKNRGTLYDENVVDTCLKMFNDDNYQMPV
jgi:PAS domain S-box-containing protein